MSSEIKDKQSFGHHCSFILYCSRDYSHSVTHLHLTHWQDLTCTQDYGLLVAVVGSGRLQWRPRLVHWDAMYFAHSYERGRSALLLSLGAGRQAYSGWVRKLDSLDT